MTGDALAEIKETIELSYTRGIHETQDEGEVRSGFHSDFEMLVKADETLQRVGLEEWFVRIEELKAANPEMWSAQTRCEYLSIDVAGYAAAVKLDCFKGEIHFSTDYMLLYRFAEGWRIVSKVFSVPA